MNPVIAIVGRPNVGKSTLFNRLSRSRDALVDDQPGVTRDRLYASVLWNDRGLTLVDTGGFREADEDPLHGLVRDQVMKAVEESDRILFLADGREGLMPGDREIANLIRRSGKELCLAVNKVDGPELDHLASDFYALGFAGVHPISAAHGYGIRTLMEDLTGSLPEADPEREDDHRVRVAVLGRPNVGKSSLINCILGADRLLVSEIPGTTRDAVDILCTWKGKEYLLIDTAGIRRKGKVREKIEKFSVIKALRSLERCHVAVVMTDAASGITDQDVRICGYAFERGRAIVLAMNKWDLVKKDPTQRRLLDEGVERQLNFLPFAPRLHLSALMGEGVHRLFNRIDLLFAQFSKRVNTGEVNRALAEILRTNPPPRSGRGGLKLYYATQSGVKPPTLVVFVNNPEKVHFSYRRFLTNQFRERLGLNLTPVQVIFRKR